MSTTQEDRTPAHIWSMTIGDIYPAIYDNISLPIYICRCIQAWCPILLPAAVTWWPLAPPELTHHRERAIIVIVVEVIVIVIVLVIVILVVIVLVVSALSRLLRAKSQRCKGLKRSSSPAHLTWNRLVERFSQNFPVNPEVLFQVGSRSPTKPAKEN